MPISHIIRYYRNPGIDATQIRLVRDITNQRWLHWGARDWGYELHYPSEILTLDKADDIVKIAGEFGATTKHYSHFTSNTGRKLRIVATNPNYVRVEVRERGEHDPHKLLDAVEKALGLVRLEVFVNTAFVAHGFDDRAQHYANELKYFLQLQGLTVYSGRSFAPDNVSDKVKGRIAKGDVLFAIVTPQEDTTWITQEITRADALMKIPFILKEKNAPFKAGLLGDREYIAFSEGHISESFIPILEGLRSMRGEESLR